ncbi:NAD(P)/FAD-dependent oxidoreductase [Muriicola sp. SD30]|uniref:NAD(P)/FAD-dependent oxidoreductase n=1 Tax=Muriicola sp. SD30 TaxID=3240936 RepID=UPI003510829F
MSKSILIVGGGIIGLSCAYFLQKKGHEVTVIDKSNMDGGASYVNAGYLTPSHIIPLASPGMMAKGIKWMFNSSSPFYMKPRLNSDFIRWAWAFNKSSTRAHVEKAIPLIKDINLLSKELYTAMHESGEMGAFQLEKKGLLMLYKTRKECLHEKEVARRAADEGLEVAELTRPELDKLQPNLSPDIDGAVHYLCDAHTSPNEIMDRLKMYLRVQGVVIKSNERVIGFSQSAKQITKTITDKASYTTDEVVMAGGSWTSALLKNLGIRMLLQPGKGYRINVKRDIGVLLPAILMEAKVAVTPMTHFTRFAGTMEFSGINSFIRKERVNAIARAAEEYYPTIRITEEERGAAQCGLRPVSPDGLPYIGRTSGFTNLTVATGHAMMGWSLGPATGKLVSELISEQPLSMPLDSFHPDRTF